MLAESTLHLPDASTRALALDTTQSFIVQAPAGSGKTELLTQRFLNLLAQAEKAPEEIIAITFTRKAAHEMRSRIYNALQFAATQPIPTEAHARTTYELAQRALQRDAAQAWHILKNPNRLRILTIDALAARITLQLPIVSGLGAQPNIADHPLALYRQAVHECLAGLETNQPWAHAIETLLLHLENDYNKIERLLIDMLARRDQWLPHILQEDPRLHLEAALAEIITAELLHLTELLTATQKQKLLSLYQYASQQLGNTPEFDLNTWPQPIAQSLHIWQRLLSLPLTKELNWRRQVTVKEGFPSVSSTTDAALKAQYQEMKANFFELVSALKENDAILPALQNLLCLPAPVYSAHQWQVINALIELLPMLVAHLRVIFQERGVVDYTEITLRALHALGQGDAPSDIALAFDYQIRHLLVDEFQDTAISQFKILELLTAGWQMGDGKTLFLVGDPMQSIYRFRKAEVGLFIRAQQIGLGDIRLKSLTLRANFRSQAPIIDWVNTQFSQILPQNQDLVTGSISFHPSVTMAKTSDHPSGVHIHPLIDSDEDALALAIVNLINELRSASAKPQIAILVLARSHLYTILPALQQAAIPYRAVEIEKLAHKPLIQDLLNLTRALLHLGDRLAWLALLRAPWCGLTLADLLILAGEDLEGIIWQQLQNYAQLPLSEDGKSRLDRCVPVLSNALAERYRDRLSQYVRHTWLALGGPACLASNAELPAVDTFCGLLDDLSEGGDLLNWDAVLEKLADLTEDRQCSDANAVEIMTIHKAKGLEFDTVIIPALERKTQADSHQLLIWQEIPTPHREDALIMAPIKRGPSEPIYDYLRLLEKQKAENELSRLLYVAVTRAKTNLHLFANANTKTVEQGELTLANPSRNSLLAPLWPMLEPSFMQAYFEKIDASTQVPSTVEGVETHTDQTETSPQHKKYLLRLARNWQPPHPVIEPAPSSRAPVDGLNHPPVLHVDAEVYKQIGKLIHEIMQQLSQRPKTAWPAYSSKLDSTYLCSRLQNLGVQPWQLTEAYQDIQTALQNILNDETAHWLLRHDHQDAQAEYELTTVIQDQPRQLIIDRTFVENGVRWIVDYKTSRHHDGDLNQFLAEERKLHRQQLLGYAKAMQKLSNEPIHLGLYFPLIPAWCSWQDDKFSA